ncbi:Nucleobase-ascorbate transporter 11 [Zea mays]|uniref:Nucleobase-ascorbate transporter 11 n=1 Tax=Zea mays TaxID=4577 RepID=A0A1D6QQM3_MAIZE|nr:Nucleobase-ascorbate transporter 11 [Zea mays]
MQKFKHIMRELQGAILVGSVFQIILGYTGLISLFMRLINPVVVALTIAAVGLAFFSYGFPQAGSCVEISMPFILLVLLCTLYMRKISLFGNHIFLVYALADYTGMRYFSNPLPLHVEFADFLKLSSLPVGKIGALLASIPLALAASVLCFTWALIVALGLSTLRYTQAASSRNLIIVGFTLFISLDAYNKDL